VAQFASISFDASFHEMFSAWSEGRILVVVPEDIRIDGGELSKLLELEAVDKIILPVVIAQSIAEHGKPLPNLHDVITTGERLQIGEPMRQYFVRKCLGSTVHNHYGPSETHVVTSFKLGADPVLWPVEPPIGRPISNTRLYILDSCLEAVPTGVIGQLYIAGTSLARGYHRRPALTAERFIPNPVGSAPGARLYKTGDRVRYDDVGNVIFLGRFDEQIKIRGHRIEPREIETMISGIPGVVEVLVKDVFLDSKDCRLAAYVVRDSSHPTRNEIHEVLGKALPSWMIPSFIVFLPRLPLTPNGKVNRAALSVPVSDDITDEPQTDLPSSPSEQLVIEEMKAILQTGNLGMHDNFFHRGGHSLLGTQLLSALRTVFRVTLPVRRLFETPTPAGLVEALASAWGSKEKLNEVAKLVLDIKHQPTAQNH
jgi:acyl-coenzyme A synthetase/AMP-(fatty) acid ligase